MNKSRARRVFIIGAGMSCEVGAPGVGNFLPQLLSSIPQSRTLNLRAYLARNPTISDLEKVLSDFERPDVWSKILSPLDYQRARRHLLYGIVRTLDNAYWEHLRRHFGLRRGDDPYYFDVRDYQVVKAVRRKHGLSVDSISSSVNVKDEVARKRLVLQERRGIDDVLPPLAWELLPVARAVGRQVAHKVWNDTLANLGVSRGEGRDSLGMQFARAARLLLRACGKA